MNFGGLLNRRINVRQRLGGITAALLAAFACCACGSLMTFVVAPRQAAQAARIDRLPHMQAADLAAAAAGDDVLITGVLAGNEALLDGSELVAYSELAWVLSTTSDDDADSFTPQGRWVSRANTVPGLTLALEGQAVQIHAGSSVQFSGPLREQLVPGDGPGEASFEGEMLPEGSRRYRGLADGDLTTVLGTRAPDGGVLPEHLFAGNRAEFEESQQQAASSLFVVGLLVMALSPIVLIGGVLFALFRRR